jgi:amino acid transporter
MLRQNENRGEAQMLTITTAIGLLHGFGFSFVLHEFLKVDSPDIWQSLLAFNVGVEIGQLLIISVAWMVFRSIARMSDRAWQLGRWGIASSCAMVALFWTFQRVSMIFDTI